MAKKPKDAPILVPHGASMRHTVVMSVAIDEEALAQRQAKRAAAGVPPADDLDDDDDPGLIPIAMSSEYPVPRYDWWEGERYVEVLDHSQGSVDLSRAGDGLPFLDSHNAYEGRAQLGRIVNVRVGADKKLRGDVKFSQRQEAQDYRQDYLDGIRREISVGYEIDPNNVQISQAEGQMKTVRVMRWTPLEASGVSVPADPTVGAGRSGELAPDVIDRAVERITAALRTNPKPAPQAEEPTMPGENGNAAPANGAGAGAGVADVRSQEQDEMKEIAEVAKQHSCTDIFAKGISEGKSPKEIRAALIAELGERVKRGQKHLANGSNPVVDLTEREEREYSFARAIDLAGSGRDGFEMEVSRAIESKLGKRVSEGKGNVLFIPTTIRSFPEQFRPESMKRAGLDSSTATKGTELKFVQPGPFIDMLRNKARVLQLGATFMAGLDGPVTFPKQSGAGTFNWMGENPGSAVSLADLALTTISLTAKTGMSATKFSKQLLRQAVVDVENLVRNDIAAIHALGIDSAAINGLGSSNQPLGVMNNTSVSVVALGTNGAQPAYADTVKLEVAVEKLNADTGPRGYLTTPSIKGTLKTTQIFPTSVSVPVWLGGEQGEVNGYPAYSTLQVPSNLTKGTSTSVCHAILYGVWSNLLIGEWGAMEVLVDPYTLAGFGMYAVTSFQMLDIALRYPESFSFIKDALAAAGM